MKMDSVKRDLDQMAAMFRLLSDKTRLNILMTLCAGERNVTSLCAHLRLPQPTISHHLALLRERNVIDDRRQGKQIFYTLSESIKPAGVCALEFSVENFLVRITGRPT